MKGSRILLLVVLFELFSFSGIQAQTIRKGDKFFDGMELYIVREVRMDRIVYMTTRHDTEMTLEKVEGKPGLYKLIPSRQAEEPPSGMEFGMRVQYMQDDDDSFLAFRKANGDIMEAFVRTTYDERTCLRKQDEWDYEATINLITTTLLNRTYLRSVSTKQELRLMRNAIMARHGYRFKSPDLQKYFDEQDWYIAGNDNNAIKLSLVEQANIQLIKSEEAEREQ